MGTLRIKRGTTSARTGFTPAEAELIYDTNTKEVYVGDGSTATTNSFLNNFTGNFVWIRVSVTEFTAGTINNIFMAH